MQLATRILEELGYEPIGFTSSAAALEAFRADPERFDALVTDERMPEMSGSALIREVRAMRSASSPEYSSPSTARMIERTLGATR